MIKGGRVSGGGELCCHIELQHRLMAQCEACHLSDWWGLGIRGCVCVGEEAPGGKDEMPEAINSLFDYSNTCKYAVNMHTHANLQAP